MSRMSVHVLIIDPQNDFCDPSGSLFVKGATEDMTRLAAMVRRISPKIDDVHVTFDSHHIVDIAHPTWWRDSAGHHPNPFTLISPADMKSGKWTTTDPGSFQRTLAYLEALAAGNRYMHCIWPEHCLIGTPGHNILPVLNDALHDWERNEFAVVDFVTKGSNPWTEHFSAVKAEVPDPKDQSTQLNDRLIQTLATADIVLLAGEARSHCVCNSVRDIVDNFDPTALSKLVLLTDAMSDVGDPPGTTLFSDMGKKFMADMIAKGVKTSTTVDFLR